MQFLVPGFLWALSALAIPVLIHLFQFRRYKKIYFSNVQLLQEAVNQQKRQQKLKHLLILAARMLALAALVFAFAQPYLPAQGITPGTQGRKVVLVVDNSLSMSRKGTSELTVIQEARQKAQEILDQLRWDDQVIILTGVIENYFPKWTSPSEAREWVKALPLSAHPWHWATQLEQAKYHLGDDSEEAWVFLISDFQNDKTEILNTNSGLKIFPIQVKQSSKIKNISIDSLWLDKPFVQLAKINTLNVVVKNHSPDTLKDVLLELSLDNKKQFNRKIHLAPGELRVEQANILVNQRGHIKGEVFITDGLSDFDNQLGFALNTSDKPKVALLYNEAEEIGVFERILGDTSLFDWVAMPQSRWVKNEVDQAQAIILSAPKTMDNDLYQSINEAINQGKSLMILPGRQSDIAALNRLLSSYNLRYGKATEDTSELIRIDYQSFLYKNAFVYEEEFPLLPTVWFRYHLPKNQAQSLLSFGGSYDFLQVKKTSTGAHIFLAAAPFNALYTDIENNNVVVPTLKNFAFGAGSIRPLYLSLDQTEIIQLPVNQLGKDAALSMNQDKKAAFIPYQKQFANRVELYPDLRNLNEGFYSITYQKETLGLVYFARPSSESIQDYVSASQLAEWFHFSELDLSRLSTSTKEELQSTLKGSTLWEYFLILCLLFLTIEIALHLFWRK